MSVINSRRCPLCGGGVAEGRTTFAVDYRDGLFIARNVPAEVCGQCGEAWLSDDSASRLEALISDAKAARRQLEIVDLAA